MNFDFRNANKNDFYWLYDLRRQTMAKYINDFGDLFNLETQTNRIMKEYDSIKIVRSDNQDIGMFKVKRNSDKREIIQIQPLKEKEAPVYGNRCKYCIKLKDLTANLTHCQRFYYTPAAFFIWPF
jgi:hypothetical protein